jgi:hypothetical protein
MASKAHTKYLAIATATMLYCGGDFPAGVALVSLCCASWRAEEEAVIVVGNQ